MPRYATLLRFPDGSTALVHTTRPAHACQVCGARLSSFQCDGQVAPGKTCDRRLCEECRTHVDPNLDYCPDHAPAPTT